jgi:hypothetical protein
MKNLIVAAMFLSSAHGLANNSYFIDSAGNVELGSNRGWNIQEKMRNGVGTRSYDFSSIRRDGGNENVSSHNRKKVFVKIEKDGHSTVEFDSTSFSSNPEASFPWAVWNSENRAQRMVYEEFKNETLVGRTECDRAVERNCVSVTVDFCKSFYRGLQQTRQYMGKDPFKSITELRKDINYCSEITNSLSSDDVSKLKAFEDKTKRRFQDARDGFSINTDIYDLNYLSKELSKKKNSGEVLVNAINACSEPRILAQINAETPKGSQINSADDEAEEK